MRVAIIIVTYNRKKELFKTLDYINNLNEAVDIVIIDNNSFDGTKEAIQKIPSLNIHYLKNDENLGSAGGFAIGMDYAKDKFDWVWLFNDDSRPHPDSLTSLTSSIKDLDDSKIGLIKIGMLKDGKSESHYWEGRRITKYIPASDKPIRTDLITFDGCLIKAEVIRNIGTCDPKYFMGIYEFDFCLRAADKGYSIYTLPNGKIEDEKKGSVNGIPYWRMYYVTRNHLFLALKRKSLSTLTAFIYLETKKLFNILLYQNDKGLKIRYKLLGIFHALTGKMGRRVTPS